MIRPTKLGKKRDSVYDEVSLFSFIQSLIKITDMDISCRLFKISVFSITKTLNEKHINLEKTTSSFLSVILINL